MEVIVGGGDAARGPAKGLSSSSSSGGGGGGGGGGAPPTREALRDEEPSSAGGGRGGGGASLLDGRLGGGGAGLPLAGGKGGTLRVGAVGAGEEIEPELGRLGSLGGARLLGVPALDLGGMTGGAPLTDVDDGVREGSLGGNTEGLGGDILLDGGEIDGVEAAAREGTGGGGGLLCVDALDGEDGTGGGGTRVGFG